MQRTAIILAGGMGTRLQTVIRDLPKPMAPVAGEPFLSHQLNYLKHYGIQHVILSVGYMADKIQAFYQDHYRGLRLSYVREDTPLGTGGGIRLAMFLCQDQPVLVLNGDSFFDVDLDQFYRSYDSLEADFLLALRRVSDASRYGTVETGPGDRIISFREKSGLSEEGRINGGVYLLHKTLYLENTPADRAFSIEKDFFETRLSLHSVKGCEFRGYFIDIGIPDDYAKAQNDFKEFKYR
jgi:D-glycero-alpha-D-manno-heptose 1-phosphate guanylyltransferase